MATLEDGSLSKPQKLNLNILLIGGEYSMINIKKYYTKAEYFKCPYCNNRFKSTHTLKKHVQLCHTLNCPICGKKSSRLVNHAFNSGITDINHAILYFLLIARHKVRGKKYALTIYQKGERNYLRKYAKMRDFYELRKRQKL